MFLVSLFFMILWAFIYVPAMMGAQGWFAFVRYINTLCYRHPKLVAKSTISAVVGILVAYIFHSNIIVVIEYAGHGVLIGAVIHILSTVFKG